MASLAEIMHERARLATRQLPGFGAPFFISGTYDDLRPYRGIVAQALVDSGNEPIEPHDRSGAAEQICQFIKTQLHEKAAAYLLLLGLRYGSPIDTSNPHSISYTEFEHAEAVHKFRYSDDPKPFFVARAVDKSDLWNEMHARATSVLSNHTEDERDAQFSRQRAFVEKVTTEQVGYATWQRICILASDEEELKQRIEVSVRNFFDDFLRRNVTVSSTVTNERFRDARTDNATVLDQLLPRSDDRKIWKMLSAFYNNDAKEPSPALCFVVEGSDAASLSFVADYVAESLIEWDFEGPVRYSFGNRGIPASSPRTFFELLAKRLGLPLPDGAEPSIEALATAILDCDSGLVFMMLNVEARPGGLGGFIEDVWKPLNKELKRQAGASADYANHGQWLTIILTHEGNHARLSGQARHAIAHFRPKPPYDFSMVQLFGPILG